MQEKKKKMIPKFQKKLQGFLSDESGKITKEDVLKMGILAMGIAGTSGGINDANAAISTSASPALPYPGISDYAGANYTNTNTMVQMTAATCTPVNQVVN